ncbi:hypothetical protein GQ55_3G056200 [Panicum hallii var. hallii]|uniref:Uncharacterized protein n=1 Tax=Panicum hallii var. hallii TaxID=1504633 RepID=A0A2T7E637_9POAL|nr:hypothetical protein GQ55_3G056200 [Panicum hallii var. hallii]
MARAWSAPCSTAAWGVGDAGFHHPGLLRDAGVPVALWSKVPSTLASTRPSPGTRSSVAAWAGIIEARRRAGPALPRGHGQTLAEFSSVSDYNTNSLPMDWLRWLVLRSLCFLAYRLLVSRGAVTPCVQGRACRNPQKRKWTSATGSEGFGGGERLELGDARASRGAKLRKRSWRPCPGRWCPWSLLLAEEGSLNLNTAPEEQQARSGRLLRGIGPRDSDREEGGGDGYGGGQGTAGGPEEGGADPNHGPKCKNPDRDY